MEFERSEYNAVWTDTPTYEWLMTVGDGRVTGCSRTGGDRGWQLYIYSISRWTKEDGDRLKRHLEIEFEEKRNRQIFWDDMVMFCYPEQYELGIFPIKRDDVAEVYNLAELAGLDETYKKYCRESGEGIMEVSEI